MGDVKKDVAVLNSQFAALHAQLAEMGQLGNIRAIDAMRGTGGKRGMQQLLSDTGAFRVESVKVASQTELFTKALKKQDITWKELRKSGALMNEVMREQYRISKMSAVGWSVDGHNRVSADMIIPRDVPERLNSVKRSFAEARAGAASWGTVIGEQRMRLGVFSEGLKSASQNLINQGKNMQWSGRQLMVGFSLPFIALGAIAGKAFIDVDSALTKIQRVYDYTDKEISSSGGKAAASENLRARAMNTASVAARQYASSMEDTLDAQGQLAAAGMAGQELQQNTISVMRASMLGQMDYNKTVDTTIALQNVFHHSAAQIADDFNYMNSMENSTVLTMDDFVDAIPRVAGILAPLGGTLQDIGTMLTAMKAGGITAAQGANALKSGLGSMLLPATRATKLLKSHNIILRDITDANNNNLLPSLEELSRQMATNGVDIQEQTRIIYALFGKQQAARINTIVSGLRQVADAHTQVGRAAKVAADGEVAWATTAEGELLTQQASVSNRFKSTLQELRVEISKAGKPFVEFATIVMGKVGGIIEAFNGMGGFPKKVMLIVAGLVALTGPLIMIAGLMRNFGGQMMRLYASVLKVASGWGLLSSEEKVQQLVAKQSESIFANEEMQLRSMSQALAHVSEQFGVLAAAQKAANEVGMAGVAAGAKSGSYRDPKTGRYATRPSEPTRQSTIIASGGNAADNEAKRGIGKGAGAAAMTAGTIGILVGGTNKWIMGLSTALLLFGSLNIAAKTQAMWGAVITAQQAAQRAGLAAMIAPATKTGALIRGAGGYARGFAGSLGAAIGPLGGILIAVTALTAGFMYLKHQSDEAIANYAKLGEVAKGAAESLGVTYNEAGLVGGNPKIKEQITLAQSLKKQYGDQLDLIAKMDNDAAKAQVKQIGVEFYLATGDSEKANQVMQALLVAAGKQSISKDVYVNFKVSGEDVLVETLNNKIDEIGSADYGKTTKEKLIGNEGTTSLLDVDENALTGKSIAEGKRQGDALAKALNQAIQNGDTDGAQALLDKVQNVFRQKIGSVTNNIVKGMSDKDKIKFEQLFKFDPDDQKKLEDFILQGNTYRLGEAGFGDFDNGGLLQTVKGYQNYIAAVAEGGDASSQAALDINSLYQVTDIMAVSAAAAAAGVKTLGNLAGMTADEIALMEGKVNGFNEAIEQSPQNAVIWGQKALQSSWGTIMDNAKEAYTSAQAAATKALQAQHEAAMKALDQEGEDKDKQFSDRGKAISQKYEDLSKAHKKYWDDRTDKVNDAIKAEQKADDIRQKIFEAEKSRMQRLAEMQNTSIDINMALGSGNMDEAAKLFNNARATQAQWALDDASATQGDSSKARQEQLGTQLEHLKDMEDAQKDRMDKERKGVEDALTKEKEAYDKHLADRKEQLAAEQKASEESAAARQKADEKALDGQLAALKAYTPRNKQEQEAQIKALQKVYDAHGGYLNTKTKEWKGMVSTAMEQASKEAIAATANDQMWQDAATHAADDITGAFGMTKDEFMAWVGSGKLPKAAAAKQGHMSEDNKYWVLPSGKRIPFSDHEGGYVGMGRGGESGRRTGYSSHNSQMPSEVTRNLQVGEYVVKKSAVDSYGVDFMEAINGKRVPKNIGGGSALGPAGLIAGAMAGVMKSMIRRQFENAAVAQLKIQEAAEGWETAPGMPGRYGEANLNASQMRNASTILTVGRTMGATNRDLLISLMTAMQESNLTNIAGGDRDSVGLFQQRPSQGWGTVAQIMDPKYAARKFFEGLLAIGDRDNMSLTAAAQAVQRSAFPNAYAKWEDEARAILAASSDSGVMMTDATLNNIRSNMQLPIEGATVTSRYGMRTNPVTGKYVLHNGTDLAAPVGTPIRAAASGQVLRAGPASGYGNWTVLGHPGGLETGYAHQRNIVVTPGQNVKRGQIIGYVGMTGNTTGPHLHFQTGLNGNWSNPNAYIPGLNIGGEIKYDNTIANLHKKETVLTAPLSESLKNGIQNLDQGAGTTYNVTMDLRGAYIKEDVDIENALDKALAKKEGRLGRKRKIN